MEGEGEGEGERERERESDACEQCTKKKLEDSNHSRNAFYFLVLIMILIQI